MLSSVDSSVRESRLNRSCRQVVSRDDLARISESFFSPKSIEGSQGESSENPLSLTPSPDGKRRVDSFKQLKAGIQPGVKFEEVLFDAENSRAVIRVKELQDVANQMAYRKHKAEKDRRAGKIAGSGACVCCCGGAVLGILALAGTL